MSYHEIYAEVPREQLERLMHFRDTHPLSYARANGIATINPRIRPFVEKSFVGMNGRRTGKSIVPVTIVVTTAIDATGPARNQRATVEIIPGSMT